MKLQGYFFDLDGVVFNTEPLYSVFWGEVGERFHPELPDFAQRIKGQTLDQIFDIYFKGELYGAREDVQRLLTAFEEQMNFPFIPGFEAFAAWLREVGCPTALVTSSNRMKMHNVYRHYPDFDKLFGDILTAEDFDESKPSPDCYLKAAARFGLNPKECVGFEDSFNGLKSLGAAGMTVVGLSTTNSAEAIQPLCDIVIPDYLNLRQLKDYLQGA
ncbi:MAG: HAD family hydrolase [Prevotella sp.]